VDLPFLRQKISTSSTPIFVSSEAENFLRAPSTPAAGFSGVHRILFPRSLGSGDEREAQAKPVVGAAALYAHGENKCGQSGAVDYSSAGI